MVVVAVVVVVVVVIVVCRVEYVVRHWRHGADVFVSSVYCRRDVPGDVVARQVDADILLEKEQTIQEYKETVQVTAVAATHYTAFLHLPWGCPRSLCCMYPVTHDDLRFYAIRFWS